MVELVPEEIDPVHENLDNEFLKVAYAHVEDQSRDLRVYEDKPFEII